MWEALLTALPGAVTGIGVLIRQWLQGRAQKRIQATSQATAQAVSKVQAELREVHRGVQAQEYTLSAIQGDLYELKPVPERLTRLEETVRSNTSQNQREHDKIDRDVQELRADFKHLLTQNTHAGRTR